MAGTIGNAGMGGGVATINETEVYNKGPCSVGCEGDVAFGTLDQFAAPFATRLINKQFKASGTAGEFDYDHATQLGVLEDVWGGMGDGTDVAAAVVITVLYPQGTFTMTNGVACDFGDVAGDNADAIVLAWTFKSYSASGDQIAFA